MRWMGFAAVALVVACSDFTSEYLSRSIIDFCRTRVGLPLLP